MTRISVMGTEHKVGILYITDRGLALAEGLQRLYPKAVIARFNTVAAEQLWDTQRVLIFIMATGIVVRTIGPLVKDKKKDPAVIVLDEKGKFAVSLLSGHLGGANEHAKEIAHFLKGKAVVTTASDVNNLTSIDMWARQKGLVIEDWREVSRIGTRLLNKGMLKVYTEARLDLPDDFMEVDDPEKADAVITNRVNLPGKEPLVLRPKNLLIGIGCNKGTQADEIEEAVKKALAENNLSFLSIQLLATIDRKGSEPGLVNFVKRHGFGISVFTAGELNSVKGITKSDAAFKATGAQAVAEPAALLASGSDKLLVLKHKIGNVTVAVAERPFSVKSEALSVKRAEEELEGRLRSEIGNRKSESSKGMIYIVGTGPGNLEHITPRALRAIESSETIVGYGTYLNLIRELLAGKEVVSTGMTKEIERCRKAADLAIAGRTVSVVSGGDPGIFAMAGLVFEILKDHDDQDRALQVEVEVIPGISALNACAARLGAPLMHDFAAISLSDRLTPWDLIEKRLEAAAMSDLVIVLYNPKSAGRQDQIGKAVDIILKWRNPQTPVGLVKAAMRENEDVAITNLEEILSRVIDMQTTVIVGNSKTFIWNNRMITPRGYETKFKV
jgi:cobalt-precorrin 5A hydrolase / precorrin-3B C17-methyltransferase